ncbi:PTS system beta-glucosides-specific IIC component [Lactobacillus colini]|uniref:PTS system beta-glucosides-specific IIC component n=1 Tax=Lactobacillus colini TaxID=1819254 RepID=A0ABS4MHL3_9LACO|nr:beta-glucoside-specific PTS transporter subunit IIABC [Lactobacillus colini]MBP2058817.1 PTS system beta-glucosides-specific IIC component [Lactobacillus colini]
MTDYHKLAVDIINNIGSQENINDVWHCATRLRFKLKDENKAKTEKIENLDGVVTVVQSAGQYQVVIGNSVAQVYDQIISIIGKQNPQQLSSEEKISKTNKNILNSLFAFVSSVFTPFLGALAASGILKGFLSLAVTLNWLSVNDGAYQVWTAASDAIFYFLPMFIAFTAAKVLKVNRFVGVAIAGALIYPNLISELSSKHGVTFFGLHIQNLTYSTSVIPILLAIWALSYLEPLFNKVFPEAIRNIFTPLLSLLIMVPLTLLVVGPIGNGLSNILADGLMYLYRFSPAIAGLLLGAFHQVIVIFGIHWALITLMINDIAKFGSDPWLPIVCIAVFGQAGAALGVFLKTKNTKMKSLAGTSFITAIFGITEPAIYGVNLKLKKPMYLAVISSGIGGAIAAMGSVKASTFTFPSILAIPTYLGKGFNLEIIGLIVALVLATVLTYLFGISNKDNIQTNNHEQNSKIISNSIDVVKGERIPLSSVNDEVFASGKMGSGYAIIPTSNYITAPFNAQVEAIFPTGHAIGIKKDDGTEVLIHIGINTVELKGKHFKTLVNSGDKVIKGQSLIKFDRTKIHSLGYDTTVMVIFTNVPNE